MQNTTPCLEHLLKISFLCHSFIYSFIHPNNIYWASYYVPDTVLGAGDTVVNKKDGRLPRDILVGRETLNKQILNYVGWQIIMQAMERKEGR